MAVYVDNMFAQYRNMKMCHLVADTEQELEDMAKQIGVNLKWWQFKGTRKSHFDICSSKRDLAIKNGAIEITYRELGYLIRNRNDPNVPFNKIDIKD